MSKQHLSVKKWWRHHSAEPGEPVQTEKAVAPLQSLQPEEDSYQLPGISRRNFLKKGGGLLAVLSLLDSPFASQLWASTSDEQVIPFQDQPPPPPKEAIQQYGDLSKINWEKLGSWITPNSEFFDVSHYNRPVIRPEDWRLEIGGLVDRPRMFTLEEIKALPRQEEIFTIECAGNHGFEWFVGAVGNAKWTGTPLAPLLRQAGIRKRGVDVVFFGSDEGEEEVRNIKIPQNFSRSMSIEEALAPTNLLAYEMNEAPLPPLHGFPVRLIAPGWYGVANVKWIKRIEVIDTRWAGRFMAKDYVTVREEPLENGQTVWTQKVVGRALPKSVTARVTKKNSQYRIFGAAWGGPIRQVEVQIDNGPWQHATIDRGQEHDFAWKFWHLDWKAQPGEHTIVSRAIDKAGRIQPTADDPRIAQKHTYWESNEQITRRIRIL
ncbi:MAG: sulfite oxidase [Nitrospirales bacterium]